MDITFADLQKMPLTKLKEYALTLGNVHGVTGMKKQQLVQAICELKGIVDPTKEAIEKKRQQAHKDIIGLKTEARKMRVDRTEKKAELNRKQKTDLRIKIKQLKRKTRKLAKI
jgi:hypothetical protein